MEFNRPSYPMRCGAAFLDSIHVGHGTGKRELFENAIRERIARLSFSCKPGLVIGRVQVDSRFAQSSRVRCARFVVLISLAIADISFLSFPFSFIYITSIGKSVVIHLH